MSNVYGEFQTANGLPDDDQLSDNPRTDAFNQEDRFAAAEGETTMASRQIKSSAKKTPFWKKLAYGVVGIFCLLVAGVAVIDATAPPAVDPSPTPPPAQANPQPEVDLVAGAGADAAATVLTGAAPAADDSPTAAPTAQAPTAPPVAPVAEVAPAAPAPAAPVSAEVKGAASVVPAKSAAKPEPAVAKAEAAKAAKDLVLAAPTAPKAEPAATPSTNLEKELSARLARMERKIAQLERAKQPRQPAATAAVSPVVRAQPVVVAPYAASSPVVVKKPAVLAGDEVRVIGVTTRQGVMTALIEFGGVKHRVGAGETVPGLGAVGSINVDASGSGVVSINGVDYH